MKGTKVTSFPHPYDPKGLRAKSGSRLAKWHQENQNQADWRPILAERYDRTTPEQSIRWRAKIRGDRLMGKSETGPGWESFEGKLSPLPHRVIARRAPPFERFGSIVVPDVMNRYSGQNAGAVYLVLAVGAGVTSLQPGNAIVASAHIGAHRGEVLGPQIRELWTDVESVQDGHNDVIKRAGGDVLAVVATEAGVMRLDPTLDRIVVKRLAAEDRERGIIVPDSAKKKSCRGEVLAVGPGKNVNGTHVEVGVSVGDVVLFGEYGGIDVRIGNDDLCVLREEEVVGVISG